MKKNKIIFGLLSLPLLSAFSFQMVSCKNNQSNLDTIKITDFVNDTVKIPKNPKKVACISRTTYDLLVAYGLGENVYGAYSGTLNNPWVDEIYPNASRIKSLTYNPSAEDLIKDGVDLVLAPEKNIAETYRKAGLNAITISLYGSPTFDSFVDKYSDIITSIWDSEIAKEKSKKWKNDVYIATTSIKNKLNSINLKTQKIFYVRGDKDRGINYTDTLGSFTEYAYRMMNLDNYSSRIVNGENRPSDEEIIKFNPDIIVCGGIYQNKNIDLIKKQTKYQDLNAVKNNQIFNIPIGFTAFEQLSFTTPIFFYDQANKLYPSIFNFDVKKLLKENLKYYFDYNLTDDKANFMLEGIGPNGEKLYN